MWTTILGIIDKLLGLIPEIASWFKKSPQESVEKKQKDSKTEVEEAQRSAAERSKYKRD